MKDEIMKEKRWEFDSDVVNCFDDMLQRSIPDYDNMRRLVYNVGSHYVKIGTTIVDIGCSSGNAIAPFVSRFAEDCDFLLLDTSEPMLTECKNRLGNLDIRCYDITQGLPKTNACLVLSILTLQFIPIEYRQKIVQSVYDSLCNGGAFVVVEKVLGNTNELNNLMVDEYYKIKTNNAYTQEQIRTKRKSLEGVLVPITAKWNEDLLYSVGFRKIDCFWRYLNFAGWIAIK